MRQESKNKVKEKNLANSLSDCQQSSFKRRLLLYTAMTAEGFDKQPLFTVARSWYNIVTICPETKHQLLTLIGV